MRKFPRNNLASVSQDWVRLHESNIRALDESASQTDLQIENFSREFHGVLDDLKSEVLFFANRTTYTQTQENIFLLVPPSTPSSILVSYTLQIPSPSRSALIVAGIRNLLWGPYPGGIYFGEPYTFTTELIVNGVTVAADLWATAGLGAMTVGYAQINGNNAVNSIQVRYSAYSFTSSTDYYDFDSYFTAQIK